jgi:hypothetical protein
LRKYIRIPKTISEKEVENKTIKPNQKTKPRNTGTEEKEEQI